MKVAKSKINVSFQDNVGHLAIHHLECIKLFYPRVNKSNLELGKTRTNICCKLQLGNTRAQVK